MTTTHVFEDDGDGDCRHCPLPRTNPRHVRPFNKMTKDEGMAAAATSRTSADFRRLFFPLLVEAAVAHEYVSTNDAWDLWEQRGYHRVGHAQAAGNAGPVLVGLGILAPTDRTVENASGNLHSKDSKVKVWRSLVVGGDLDALLPAVLAKAATLDQREADRKAEQRDAALAEALTGVTTRDEYRVVVPVVGGWRSVEEPVADAAAAERVAGRYGGRVQKRTVIVSPWEDLLAR